MGIEEKARALYMVEGIDVIGLDSEGELYFSFIGYERQVVFNASKPLIYEMYRQMAQAKQLFFSFFTAESTLYHALAVHENVQRRFIIMGPIGFDSKPNHKENVSSIPVRKSEQIVYLGRLLYWIYYPDENRSFAEPIVFLLQSIPSKIAYPEISLFHLYYKQEPLHITYEEYHKLWEFIKSGDLTRVEQYLDSMTSFQEGVNRFSLSKGDILRSAKNHFIATCAIVCTMMLKMESRTNMPEQ